ncbi:NAD(P)/FAD-dependent oxidoreductase [Cellulomonas humilata]|uniref:3-phenylpropionate/trans-cinnamate dioxygenase ferredoxin reductase subunit n=1 Tax=Cellulomonas humilata TaxID=144055 RepID=A0ABU0EEN0_9CELL|nr:FAD-dependent oxidoreductase [Cellulomonas humilata]MDQ0373730.1 3-phenylpropionate/trans-cinnamate dioxygenase ferredoxin reductase subunit [Cellulomonas humilata]
MSGQVVVVGGGLAGAKTVEGLRERGYDGGIVLLGTETERPYERPPLSKGYLQGSDERDGAFVHPADWYGAHDVDLRLGTTVRSIDLGARDVVDGSGTRTGWDHLVLATGSEPRRLDVPGAGLDGVVHLRTLDDSDRLRALLRPGTRVVVVGGGWIGLEVTAAARAAGCEVSVLVRDPLPLLAVLGPELAAMFADLHRENGVDLRTRTEISEIVAAGDGTHVGAVELADGTLIDADLVVVGIGAAPRVDLAKAAGLHVEDGVVVDAHLRSSNPHVLAVGDIARAHHPFLGTHLRVEHWANALNQPATAAATVVGADEPYDKLPYFFTDQFDLGMEYVGYVGSHGYDEVVVRGDLQGRELIAFWRREGRVLAAMNVNVWDVVDDVQALIRSRAVIDHDRLADPDVPLAELL